MTEKRKNSHLLVGLTLLGLTAWSALSSAKSAPEPSPFCKKQVQDQMDELQGRTGNIPSKAHEQELMIHCSEAQLGVQVETLWGKRDQVAGTDKEEQCRVSVKFSQQNNADTQGRSVDELVKICMELPADHVAACGFPAAGSNDYFVLNNGKCEKKNMVSGFATLAKNDGHHTVSGDTGNMGGDGGKESGNAR